MLSLNYMLCSFFDFFVFLINKYATNYYLHLVYKRIFFFYFKQQILWLDYPNAMGRQKYLWLRGNRVHQHRLAK